MVRDIGLKFTGIQRVYTTIVKSMNLKNIHLSSAFPGERGKKGA